MAACGGWGATGQSWNARSTAAQAMSFAMPHACLRLRSCPASQPGRPCHPLPNHTQLNSSPVPATAQTAAPLLRTCAHTHAAGPVRMQEHSPVPASAQTAPPPAARASMLPVAWPPPPPALPPPRGCLAAAPTSAALPAQQCRARQTHRLAGARQLKRVHRLGCRCHPRLVLGPSAVRKARSQAASLSPAESC